MRIWAASAGRVCRHGGELVGIELIGSLRYKPPARRRMCRGLSRVLRRPTGGNVFQQTARPIAICACFLLSGASGLVYEVVWTRWLTAVLGSASAATAIVLATFMAGLGAGSWFGACWADQTSRPLRRYGQLEIIIAILAVLLALTAGLLDPLFGVLSVHWGPTSPMLHGARLVSAAVLIGPLTVLIGATFPLFVCALAKSSDRLGQLTAVAYGANSLGGAAGTLLAGFFFIEAWGLRGAFAAAVAGGLAAGCIAWRLDAYQFHSPLRPTNRRVRRRQRAESKRDHVASKDVREPAARFLQPGTSGSSLLAAAALAGFAGLGLEAVWTRALSLLTLNTTYAFSLMLATVLLGLSLGSCLLRWCLSRVRSVGRVYAFLQVSLVTYALVSLWSAPYLAAFSERLTPADTGEELAAWLLRPALMGVMLLLVPTTIMGALFPLLCDLYGRCSEGFGRPAGRVYGCNTLGAVLGSLVVGLAVIPHGGTWWATALCCTAAALSAVAVLWPRRWSRQDYGIAISAGTLTVVSFVPIFMADGLPISRRGLKPDDMVRFQAEDESGLVEVVEDRKLGTRWMLTNRLHWEGSTLPRAVAEQRKQALLPLLLHPAPRDVLEIGLGTGIKRGILKLPCVDRATIVEISPAVIEASQLFEPYQATPGDAQVESQTAFETLCADGRNFVAYTPRQFDVIVNGLLTPYRAGVGRLYTQEHFEHCRAKLNQGGIFVVWVAYRQIAPEDLKVLVRTLLTVFPNTTMWLEGYYLALVSSDRPMVIDADAMESVFHREPYGSVLQAVGMESPATVLAGFVAGGETLGRYCGDGPLNTEDRPIIEFRTPRLGELLNSRDLAAMILSEVNEIDEPLSPPLLLANDQLAARIDRAHRARQLSRRGLLKKCRGDHLAAAVLFQQALQEYPDDDLAQYELEVYLVAHAKQCLERGLADEAQQVFRQAVNVNPQSVGAWASLASLAEATGQTEAARQLWRQVQRLDPNNRHFRLRVAVTADLSNQRRR